GRDLKHTLEKASASAKHRFESDGNEGGDWFSSLKHSVSTGAHKCQRGLEENPVGMAAGLLGVGVLLGSLFPGTQRENELLGDYAESMKTSGRKMFQKGSRVAKTAAQSALHEV